MATASKIHLSPSQKAEFRLPGISSESAGKASELLQKNHENFHVFFNQSGFHNHIAHHLLTLFALAASPSELQKGYDENATYQRPAVPVEGEVVSDMHDPARYKSYLGNEKYYHDFLVFFQKEMDAKGWQNVLNEYVFKGDERAEDMLVRMFAGFLHPVIHLGFGVEFEQPAIVAEALAQAAVHDRWIGVLFEKSDKVAKAKGDRGQDKTIVQLLEEIRGNGELRRAVRWDDGNKIRDGILKRAPEDMIAITSQYHVGPGEEELERKTAEMINAAVYFTTAAQRPPHLIKFDFFFMHCLNSSIFFSSFIRQPWLSPTNKARLLEMKVRLDLAMYASRAAPELLLDEVQHYQPKHGRDASWDNVFTRVKALSDDGHASKFIRALAHGEDVCKKFENHDGFKIKADMWRLLGHAVIDSVEETDTHWVRSCGFDEAWVDIPLREGARL